MLTQATNSPCIVQESIQVADLQKHSRHKPSETEMQQVEPYQYILMTHTSRFQLVLLND